VSGNRKRRIFALVAGEASGDQLGAALISELRKKFPDAQFVGIGGAGMRAAGMDCWWDSEQLAVFGLFEVLSHFPRLLGIRHELRRKLQKRSPDAFIGIDAPDFNLGLERRLKSAGIRTIQYVSPTVWAWRAWRVRKIAKAADLVLCLFPFEPAFYRARGIAAVYVGHPMAEEIALHSDTREARRVLGLDEGEPVVALFPGSRAGEVSRLSASMVEAAALLAAEHPGTRFAAAIANQRADKLFRDAMAGRQHPEILLVQGQPRIVLAAADVVICASGTATLEAMLINRPVVVTYRLAAASYWLARTLNLVKSRFIALPNILAGEALVPELIQHEATGPRMAREASRWLQDEASRHALMERFEALHRELLRDAGRRPGDAIAELLGPGP
jgi:lipid-A-disaccharide synthase